MKRFLAWIAAAWLLASPAFAAQIIITSGTTYAVPIDWNPNGNTVEVIGGGGAGFTAAGGGGAYSKKNNVALTPGATVSIQIGAGGTCCSIGQQDATDTWFVSSGTVMAKGGVGGPSGGAGGAAARAVSPDERAPP